MVQIMAFTEIGVMQRLAHVPGVCKLHDYGISRQGIYLVMTRYSCSLHAWLAKQTVKQSLRLRLYTCDGRKTFRTVIVLDSLLSSM